MEQIERIQKMEERLDCASQVVMKLSAALDDYSEMLEDIRALESYYGSEEWKKDFDDDEAHRLTKNLKRGVLSEDAIWNMLEDHRVLKARMEENRQEMSSIVDKEGKIKKYRLLTEQIRALIEGETDSVAVMANVCAAIHEAMGFWWTGFYRVLNKELVLGPFQGPVACMHIGYGKGVCGTAWKERRTIIVPDVKQFPGHIACSSFSRSEIVVPVFSKDGEVVAVLDIDSKELATFDDIDQRYLEEICKMLLPLFVKQYSYRYPRPAVTADCVVMTKEMTPHVLLIQRGIDPYKGCWAFPGGFMNMDETTEQCAVRELKEETGLQVSQIQQIGAYSKVDRDPRGRTVTVAYLAIVDEPIAVTGQDDAAKAQWFPIDALPPLAFDHEEIMRDAIKKFSATIK